jgi:iron complex outermembrane receptor protein
VATYRELWECANSRPLEPASWQGRRALCAFGALAICLPALADQPAATSAVGGVQLEEVIVTAQKRDENLQNVPISVVAVSSEQLAESHIQNTADLQSVIPGYTYFDTGGYAQPHLRGVGTVANGPGVENPIALYVDGVYYGAMSASTFALNNIEQIEVDRGPQGTLFGRNATGGLIQITTRDPSQQFEGEAGIGYGDYQTATGTLYVTGPIIKDVIVADFAAFLQNQEQGFGRNLYTGNEVNFSQNLAFRSKWLFTPSTDTQVKVVFDYSHDKFTPAWLPAPGTTPLGGVPYTGPTQGLDGYEDPWGLREEGGVSVRLQQELGWAQFVSLTAYRRSSLDVSFDGSLVPSYAYLANLLIHEPHTQVTEELQLLSPADSSIKWVAGAYLYYSQGQYDPINVAGGLIAPLSYINNYSVQWARSPAIYGQATKELMTGTTLTLGLRYTQEERSIEASQVLGLLGGGLAAPTAYDSEHETFRKPTWRVSLDHKFGSDLLGYVSYNRGFKSGGYNDDTVPTSTYAPETLDAYEIGTKADLFSHRLRVDIAGFYYDYKNVQAVRYPAGFELIFNGAAAEIYGVDLDVTYAATEGLVIKAGLEALHSDYTSFPSAPLSSPAPGGGTNFTSFDAAGDQVALAPKWTGNLSANYTIPVPTGTVVLSGDYSYNNGWFAEPDNRLRQPGYSLANASATWKSPDDKLSVRFWAKNLTDKQYLVYLVSQGQGDLGEYAPPRTYGVMINRRF